jgi:hypothetical protein
MPDIHGNPLVHFGSEGYRPACGKVVTEVRATSEDPTDTNCLYCRGTIKWRNASKDKHMTTPPQESVGIPTIHMAVSGDDPAAYCGNVSITGEQGFSTMDLNAVSCEWCKNSVEFKQRNDYYTNLMSPTVEPGYVEPVGKFHDAINIPAKDEPHWTHDCQACVYLGRDRYYGNDLYWCGQGDSGHSTVIARYGNAGPEYQSGIANASENQPLALALVRAIKLGLITSDDLDQL